MKDSTTMHKEHTSSKISYDELVFEYKNKAYGAFELRQKNDRFVLIGMGIASLSILLLFAIPLILFLATAQKEGTLKVQPKKIVRYSELSAPPPIELTPPPQVRLPPKEKAKIKYLPPVVKPDEEVPDEEMIPTQEDLSNINPGTATVESDDSIIIDSDVEVIYKDPEPEPVKRQEPFAVVEEMPEFPGGDIELLQFIKSNVRYPQMAIENDIEGKVYVRFVINPDGSVTDITILRGIGAGCDEEAIRVVKRMPNWIPGRQRGRPVPVAYVLPINFTIRKK